MSICGEAAVTAGDGTRGFPGPALESATPLYGKRTRSSASYQERLVPRGH